MLERLGFRAALDRASMTAIPLNAWSPSWRSGDSWPSCGARAGEVRRPRSRRGARPEPPATCSRSAGSANPRRPGQCAPSDLGRGGRARRRRGDQSDRHIVRTGREKFDAVQAFGAEAVALAAAAWRAHDPRLGNRRRRTGVLALCALEGRRRETGACRRARRGHSAALAPVRTRRRLFQQVRRHRRAFPRRSLWWAAAIPCSSPCSRETSQGGRRRDRRSRPGRPDLRARRSGSAQLQGADAFVLTTIERGACWCRSRSGLPSCRPPCCS